MVLPPAERGIRPGMLWCCIALTLGAPVMRSHANDDIEFNTDILDVNDRSHIDLSQFSRSGFIMPGTYSMVVQVNKNELPEQQITFYPPDNASGSQACISQALTQMLGFKANVLDKLSWWHQGECLDTNGIEGMGVQGDLSTSSLHLNIPQAFLEYTDENWDPPSLWDEGVPGLIFDYNLNVQSQHQQQVAGSSFSLSGNGTAGMNVGAWRFRADWQGQADHQSKERLSQRKPLEWNRYYLFRPVPALRARLMLGENYLTSGMFDSFRFAGASLITDDMMLPPNLRGYAPEIVGVAKTNAKVTVSQQGRVLYETNVAAGAFRIQDINDAVSGEMNVRVEEQDGSVQEFSLNTSSIPYLTRPGSVRFKLAMGRPIDVQHHAQGPLFATGEFSWGISNGWSLYGGALSGESYNSLSLGMGRDLMVLGALSFDATQSWARIPHIRGGGQSEKMLSGGSYRLSYSKRFDDYDSQVTFAGYRFSQQDFMSMSEYIDALHYGMHSGNGKEMYSLTFNKNFRELALSAYLTYSHETYWTRPDNDRYNLALSRYFNLGSLRNLSLSLSAYQNQYNGLKDNGLYVSLALPWGKQGTMSYNVTASSDDTAHNVSYADYTGGHDSYQVSAGRSRNGESASGFYSHEGGLTRASANVSYQPGRYSALGLSAQGGSTLTVKGGALHRGNIAGGTRLLLDTEGVADIPVRSYGNPIRTNRWGKVVIGDVNHYIRTRASIDLNQLDGKAEAATSVVQATLTEGAIGYRKFRVIAGQAAMAVIKLVDGSEPPFGATLRNHLNQETGIVDDGGNVYLTGIQPDEVMTVNWNGETQCEVRLPASLPDEMMTNTLLLPCHALSSHNRRIKQEVNSAY